MKFILGPGTGLGEAMLFKDNVNNYHVLATEGGHTAFSPVTDT